MDPEPRIEPINEFTISPIEPVVAGAPFGDPAAGFG
jgi:hypothetical protein